MASGVSQTALGRIFGDLTSKDDDVRQRAKDSLRELVATASRDLSTEQFTRLNNDINKRIFELCSSSDDKLGGVMAIEALIDLNAEENTKLTRFANYLRLVLPTNDVPTMIAASKALGRLATPGGTLTSDLMEFEVKRALEWLSSDRHESRRHAAVLVLRELAKNSPTLFYAYVPQVLELIWTALRDPKVTIRESAAECLSSCLEIISQREAALRIQWYNKILEEAQYGLKANNVDWIHGSLLAYRELLLRAGMFMHERYNDVCEVILRHRDHKDGLIRRTVVSLIPRLAEYNPEEFVQTYLHKCMGHLLGQLRKEKDRSASFIAIGQVAIAVGSSITPYLDHILASVKDGLAIASKGRNKATANDAAVFQCISMLATAVGQALTKHLHDLLELMFACGLTEPLRQALVDLAHNIPPLLPVIQERLLHLLSIILSGQSFRAPGSPDRVNSNLVPSIANQQPADGKDSELITLALNTLGGFDFTGNVLNEFVRDVVINYVEDDNPEVRKAAALSSCQLFIKDPIVYQTSNHAIQVVSQVLEKLLTVGITDPDPNIRLLVLSALDEKFDRHLAQSRNIRTLFIALNDEVFQIREVAISIIGRLTAFNPGHVMPSLRKTLIQLLTELEYSTVNRNKEEAARLLGLLISNAKTLVKPYVELVLKVLLPKAHDPNAGVASSILACIGELAKVGGEDLYPYIKGLMPLIIETLQDQSSSVKRDTSLRTLGELASNSGYVIQPYLDFPNLFELFISILKSEQAAPTRRETVKVMGILGALDPYKYQTADKADKVAGTADQKDASVDISMLMIGLGNTEEYYPTVVMGALMMILKDPSLNTHHTAVIQAIMSMYKALGLKCVSFLPEVIPAYLSVMRNCPPTILEFYFQQLGILVGIVKQHIRNFMQDILTLIRDFWRTQPSLQPTILRLVESMARALEDEFKPFLPTLIPLMLQTFETDISAARQTTRAVLQTLVTFGPNIEEYMHLVLPVIVDTVEKNELPTFLRKEAIVSIARLSRVVNLSDHASRIIHPLARVIVSSNFDLRLAALDTLCALVFSLGYEYLIFIPMVNKLLVKSKISHPNYELLVAKLLNGESLPQDLSPERKFGDGRVDDVSSTDPSAWKLAVNPDHLRNAWEASQRSTKEDWQEWIRRLNLELLKESPSPALRSCATLASSYAPLAKELFNAAFLSCWVELEEQSQEELMKALETALTSTNTPPDLVQILLNLAEYMEHADKPLPFDIRTLSAYAGRCHAYAKALHYKETEYISDRGPDTIENLISINKELQLPDAAIGILTQAQRHDEFELLETWYEKLQRWDDALAAWNRRPENEQHSAEVLTGKMRCYHALGEWDELSRLVQDRWKHEDMSVRRKIAPHAAAGAWNLGQWDLIDDYVSVMRSDSADYSFFKAIICLHRNEFAEAAIHIRGARDLVDRELTALVGESYARAYSVNVRVQMLAELEEIIQYKQNPPEKKLVMRRTWMKRLMGVQRNVDVWQRLLKVRALVISPQENMDMWIKFANLCRKSNRMGLAEKTLHSLLGGDDESHNHFTESTSPQVVYAWLKFAWARGEKSEALSELQDFSYHLAGELGVDVADAISSIGDNEMLSWTASSSSETSETTALLARCFHKQAEWQIAMQGHWIDHSSSNILQAFSLATQFDPNWHKAWHSFAIAHFDVVTRVERAINEKTGEELPPYLLKSHVIPAIKGFFRSISLSARSSLQDTLRLLRLMFRYGNHADVNATLSEGFGTVNIDTWLEVIPQLIARIHAQNPTVRRAIHQLLTDVGKAHPQALIYPLTVASKSKSIHRRKAALAVMEKMRIHSATLVEQALLVSQELVRVAILWNEQWHEGIEEAARLYFVEHDEAGMFAQFEPLHEMLEKGPETLREVSFHQAHARDLNEARNWGRKYQKSGDVGDLNQAWDLYYKVMRTLRRQLPSLTSLDLQYVSPKLLEAHDLEIAVPGTYSPGKPVVTIKSFVPTIAVIASKRRPRKVSIKGSDGRDHVYVLKGHEDIRQDERVMQLFGLVNKLLSTDTECFKRHLNIERYPVIPLSPNSALLGWVPGADTLNLLIREYRDSRKILVNIEQRLMLQMAPDYDNLTLMQKVEVFEYALDNTTGHDLWKVLWLRSKSSEAWLDRRTNYTRSLAVMSMVGYILGLGDRHPSNLMLDRNTGKIVHIDFGDCFEVAMHRDKYPETVPFRLTRMLMNAMEVSNIEGSFRITCEHTMRVLRDNKESLMAVLEAFVYDPLINWKLQLQPSPTTPNDAIVDTSQQQPMASVTDGIGFTSKILANVTEDRPQKRLVVNESELIQRENTQPDAINELALQVLNRVQSKLTGRDFKPAVELNVPTQVDKLIEQAHSLENLCILYVGWCPFW